MRNYFYITLIPLLPLATFVLLGLFGRSLKKISGIVGTASMLAATVLSFAAAYNYFFVDSTSASIEKLNSERKA